MTQAPGLVTGASMDRRIERPRARRWLPWAGGAVALPALAIALYLLVPAAGSLAVDTAAVRIGAVTRAPFRDYVPLRAEVAPLRTVFVTAVAGGQVAAVAAGDGQLVAAGTPLARLLNPALQLEVASRSAEIAGQLSAISSQRLAIQQSRAEAGRELAAARNDLTRAEALLRQKQILYDHGIVTRPAIAPLIDDAAYQRARVDALARSGAQSERTLSDQSAGVAATARQLLESLAMTRAGLAALTVRAPVGGRLTAFVIQPGQMLKAGEMVGQVDAVGAWKLTAEVDQYYLGRVRPGLAAIADLDGGNGVPLTVTKVLPQVADGRFRVELGFAGRAPAGLNRGQTMDVRLTLGADRPAVVAPSGGWLDAGGTTAFVLAGEHRAVRRAITTGRRNPDQVEVVSGLSPGERIVTTALATYAPYRTLLIR